MKNEEYIMCAGGSIPEEYIDTTLKIEWSDCRLQLHINRLMALHPHLNDIAPQETDKRKRILEFNKTLGIPDLNCKIIDIEEGVEDYISIQKHKNSKN
jgi:hypothetical protein